MDNKINKLKQNFRYYLLSCLSSIIYIIGYIGVKMTIAAFFVGIALLTDSRKGDWNLPLGWLIGLSVGGILIMGLDRLYPYMKKLESYAKTYKRYPYTEKFGRDYPQPKPEDFGITRAEFKDYRRRFQLDFIKLIFTFGLCIAAGIYIVRGDIKGLYGVLLMGGAVITAVLLNYLFDYWSKRISQKHRYYEKINQFQNALRIYYKIRDENKNY